MRDEVDDGGESLPFAWIINKTMLLGLEWVKEGERAAPGRCFIY